MVEGDLFITCHDEYAHLWRERFNKFLNSCANLLVDYIGRDNVRGIYLCGSFASSEGSVVFERGSPIILSDIDLVVVLESFGAFLEFYPRKGELAEACERLLTGVRFAGRIDVGLFVPEYMRSLPPSPGVYDMKNRGQVLYGDEGVLEQIPEYQGAEISGVEASILIENRIVALLGAYPGDGAATEENMYMILYGIGRVYTDILTSALCLSGFYRSGYIERLEFLKRTSAEGITAKLLSGELAGKIEKWTRFKIEPSVKIFDVEVDDRLLSELWEESASDVIKFWAMAVKLLRYPHSDPSDTTDSIDSILSSKARTCKWLGCLRSWKEYLSGLPLVRRIALAMALGIRFFSAGPMDIIREHGIRLLDYRLMHGPGGAVPRPRGGFPHNGGAWRQAAYSLYSLWVEFVSGRKGS